MTKINSRDTDNIGPAINPYSVFLDRWRLRDRLAGAMPIMHHSIGKTRVEPREPSVRWYHCHGMTRFTGRPHVIGENLGSGEGVDAPIAAVTTGNLD